LMAIIFASKDERHPISPVPFAQKAVCRRPKPEFRAEDERPGFLTACDRVEQPLGLAC
jgi:hypothetical protein